MTSKLYVKDRLGVTLCKSIVRGKSTGYEPPSPVQSQKAKSK